MLETIKTRRSVRAYTGVQIPEPVLEQIVLAGLCAPSAMNSQVWQLTVVQKEEELVALQAAIKKTLGRSEYHRFYNAPTLVIVTTPRDYKHGAPDCAVVLENMFLAAHAQGVGSVWINQLVGICDTPEIREILTRLEVPIDHICYGCAALGYPAGEVATQRENKGIVKWIR